MQKHPDLWTKNTYLTANRILKLVKICAATPQFEFDGTFYKQLSGLAMGSPLSPFLAGLFMEEFEKEVLENTDENIIFYARYVDDCFLLAESMDSLNKFLVELNSHDSNGRITFTCEMEAGKKLPFLDILMDRSQGNLHCSVYRKKTDSGRYTHFSSFQPAQHKIGTIDCLARRGHQVCSSYESLIDEKSLLKSTFLKCGYPKQLIEMKLDPIRPSRKPKERPKLSVTLPFYPSLTSKISSFLSRFDVKSFTQKGVTLGHSLYKKQSDD